MLGCGSRAEGDPRNKELTQGKQIKEFPPSSLQKGQTTQIIISSFHIRAYGLISFLTLPFLPLLFSFTPCLFLLFLLFLFLLLFSFLDYACKTTFPFQ